MMLPILEFCQSGESVSTSDLNATIADLFMLTDQERSLAIGPGRLRYKNRVTWAAAHLVGAGLLTKEGEGEYRITPSGKEVSS